MYLIGIIWNPIMNFSMIKVRTIQFKFVGTSILAAVFLGPGVMYWWEKAVPDAGETGQESTTHPVRVPRSHPVEPSDRCPQGISI